jgi:hypothetical protein
VAVELLEKKSVEPTEGQYPALLFPSLTPSVNLTPQWLWGRKVSVWRASGHDCRRLALQQKMNLDSK